MAAHGSQTVGRIGCAAAAQGSGGRAPDGRQGGLKGDALRAGRLPRPLGRGLHTGLT